MSQSAQSECTGVKVYTPSSPGEEVVVIGSGPVGMRFVDELLRRQPLANIHVFGNEPYRPYNRVQLSTLLAGTAHPDTLDIPFPDEKRSPNFRYTTCAIVSIDIPDRSVVDALGRRHHFDRLVIATGARAHIPHIDGANLTGVYTFRNMKDAQALYSRVARARHVVVIGGGLLGIEAAKGLTRFNTKVTLIQQAPRLMNRQLDEASAQLLQMKVESIGIDVVKNAGVREIMGRERVESIRTRDGQIVACDTVLMCAGIRPNLELARAGGIRVATGIVVDDALQTSAEHVYAIGECCEHAGRTYGLVAPGFEQASVLAENLSGGCASYQGSMSVSRLKVLNETVVSLGEVADLPARPMQREVRYSRPGSDIYRKVVIHKGRLIGAVGLGGWSQFARVQEAFQSGRYIWPWQWLLFWLTGRLWLGFAGGSVQRWPAQAVVCQCNQVTVGTLLQAQARGCDSVEALGRETRAGTVCGSCRPLLAQLTGTKLERTTGWLALLSGSVLAIVVTVLLLWMPAAQVAESVQQQGWFEAIWNDKTWKQISGFSLLGLVLIGLLMSLRKRLQWQWMGAFSAWRLMHIFLGVAAASLLMLHTGFHLGDNLNRVLMITFVTVVTMGSLAGVVAGLSHTFSPGVAATLQKSWNWLHIVAAWPLPVLLLLHILTVYYF